jgi:hypothetical protein
MWKCPNCGRTFEKHGQMHSCQTKSLDEHFKNKDLAKSLFEVLFKIINKEVGKCKVVSIPCCIHLYGEYDFLAALPKRDRLEIRFGLYYAIKSPRIKQAVPISEHSFKICIDIKSKEDIDSELMDWVKEAYHLKGSGAKW